MRNLILVAIAVFLIVLLGGGAIVWYFQAEKMEQSIKDLISDINKDEPYITYSAIETSGFPLALNVSIVNPRFTGGVDKFLVSHFAGGAAKEQSPFRDMRSWTEDVSLDGRITMSANLLSNEFTLRSSGNWKDTTSVTGKSSFLTSHETSDLFCTLTIDTPKLILGGIWKFPRQSENPITLANSLRSLDCNNPSSTITQLKEGGDTEETLVSNGPQRIFITHDMDANNRQIHIFIKSSDVEFSQAGSNLMHAYALSFDKDAMPPRVNDRGPQNLEFDMAMSVPIAFQNILAAPLNITISKAYYDSQIETNEATFTYDVSGEGATRTIKLATRLDATPKEGYDLAILNKVHDFFHSAYLSDAPRFAALKSSLTKFTKEDDVHAIIGTAIPKFEPLKKLFYGIDLVYQGNQEMTAGSITLNDLQLGALPYGIAGNGTLRKAADKMPEPNLTLTCRGCSYLIDDVADFANRLQQAYAKFDPVDAAPMVVQASKVESLKGFLKTLAAKENSEPGEDYTYQVTGNGTLDITINGKGLDVVQGLYTQHFPPAPAARAKH